MRITGVNEFLWYFDRCIILTKIRSPIAITDINFVPVMMKRVDGGI